MWKNHVRLAITCAAILTATTAATCGNDTPAPSNTFCLVYEPVEPTQSERDMLSDLTEQQIDVNNAKWDCLCGKPPICPEGMG